MASLVLLLIAAVMMTACGGGNTASTSPAATNNASGQTGDKAAQTPAPATPAATTKKVKYLDKEYTLPADTKRIVMTGAVEAMEDAIVLDVQPVGAITFSGVFPPMFQSIAKSAKSIGEKSEPNFESIIALKPDVILGTPKFKPEVAEKLEKIAPTIPYSHIATDWEANLLLLGELSGKKAQAEQAIAKYKSDLSAAKLKLGEKLKGKKVVAIRIRNGDAYIYPDSIFFNPSLYGDLGLEVPAEVKAAKAQELISVEKLAEMNPDYMFIQFSPDENKDKPNGLDDFKKNPILKNVNALKNNKAFVNVVDPLAQGGTAYSKIEFLKAAVNSLNQ
jgi:iron complex transport system substrate-binding protein